MSVSRNTQQERVIHVLHPELAPFIGIYPSAHPLALGPGRFEDVYNLRPSGGGLVCRGPVTALGSAVGTSALGLYGALVNGTYYLLVASVNTGKTRVYWVDMSTGAATEITAGSGKYGDTRLSSTSAPVAFAVVHDYAARKDVVVISNGTDDVRIWDEANTITAVHKTVPLPSGKSSVERIEFGWAGPVPLGNTTYTVTNSGGGVTGAHSGSSPNKYMRLTISNTVATNDNSYFEFTAVDMRNAKQLHLVYEVDGGVLFDALWDDIKVEVYDGSGWHTVYEPFTVNGDLQIAENDDIGRFYTAAFPLEHISDTARSTISRIRFTWVGSARASGDSYVIDFYGIGASGMVPARARYAFSYYNSGSRAESQAIIVRSYRYLRVDEADTGAGTQRMPDLSLSETEGLFYKATCYYQNTANTERDAGVDYLRVYRRDPGDDPAVPAVFAFSKQIAAYTASWAFSSGSEYQMQSTADTVDSSDRDLQSWVPDAFHRVIPKAKVLKAVLDRLHCGNLVYDSYTERGAVWVSEERNPFRFRLSLRRIYGAIDPTSAALFSIAGEEVRAFALAGAYASGGTTVYTLTDRSLFGVADRGASALSSPQYIGPYGTLAGATVQSYLGTITWLSMDKQIVRVAQDGSIESLSLYVTDSLISGSTAPENSAATVFKNSYLMAFQRSGASTNDRVLVFDYLRKQFVSNDRMPGTSNAKYMVVVPTAKGDKMFVISAAGQVYKYDHEDANGDLGGSTIAVGLKTGAFHFDGFFRVQVSQCGYLGDTVSGGSMSTARTALFGSESGDSPNGTIDIDDATAIWKYDLTTKNIPPGVSGNGVQLALDGNLIRGAKIIGVSAKVRPFGDGAQTT